MKKQVLAARIVRWESSQQLSEGHHAMKDNTLASIRQLLYNPPNEDTTRLLVLSKLEDGSVEMLAELWTSAKPL